MKVQLFNKICQKKKISKAILWKPENNLEAKFRQHLSLALPLNLKAFVWIKATFQQNL